MACHIAWHEALFYVEKVGLSTSMKEAKYEASWSSFNVEKVGVSTSIKEAWHEALFHVEKVGLSKSIKEAHVFIQENRFSVICPAAYQNLMVIYWRLNCMCVVPLPGWWFDDDFLYSTGSRIG